MNYLLQNVEKKHIILLENDMRQHIDLYFIDIVKMVGSRGTCNRGKSGCVIVRDKQIISTGYVGAPKGLKHCDQIGHELEKSYNKKGEYKEHCVRTTHAEQNAIVQAAKNGMIIRGSDLYCTMVPCYNCAKMIINVGIKRVIADYNYHDAARTKKIFKEAKVKLKLIHKIVKKYENEEKISIVK
jgi:dCMP deaminase